MKRSNKKIISADAKVLKYMRKSRRMSQQKVAQVCGICESAIGHYEHGRMGISKGRLEQFLRCFDYTEADFKRLWKAPENLPATNVRQDCIELLHMIDNSKLFGLYSMLKSFV